MSAEELMSYANWIVEFGQTNDSLTVLGRCSDPASAAARSEAACGLFGFAKRGRASQ